MPKYFCDYCDTYLTHDSPTVRKTHISGRKHIDNVKHFYQKLKDEETQKMIDATTAAFRANQKASNPFAPVGAMTPVHPIHPMLMHPGGLMHPMLTGPPHMMMGPGGGMPQMMVGFNVLPSHMTMPPSVPMKLPRAPMMAPQVPMMAIKPHDG
nr:U1 small nuclear ribonucleoprotein C-like [Leptinotarsa decemlineata]